MNILCYGDSNTWGYIPNINGYSKNAIPMQYDKHDCWWYSLIKHNLYINGLCGRCVAHENKWLENRNAFLTIHDDLKKYKNLDIVIIQLGTNDCKSEYNDSSIKIANNIIKLVQEIKKITNSQVMIISPPQIIENTIITKKYYKGANEKTLQLNKLLEEATKKHGLFFISGIDLNIGEDGEHLTLYGHKQLASKVSAFIKRLEENNETYKN